MSLSKLAVRRLTKLADYMESLPAEARKHFNMRDVLHLKENDTDWWLESTKPVPVDTVMSCGSSACAAGWALTIPAFKKAGYKMSAHGFFGHEVSDFFHISMDQVNELFGPDLPIHTPKQWARHARRYIKEHAT